MELADYNITFVHIKGSNNILADAIYRLNTLEIYKVLIEDLKCWKLENNMLQR